MATILRRIQQLEHRLATEAPAADASGARELLIARINRMSVALRASPDWKGELSPVGSEEVKARLRECLHQLGETRVKSDTNDPYFAT